MMNDNQDWNLWLKPSRCLQMEPIFNGFIACYGFSIVILKLIPRVDVVSISFEVAFSWTAQDLTDE